MGFPINGFNTQLTITPLGGSEYTYTGSIYDYSETPFKREISYDKVIGGAILPNYNKADSIEISFKFITNDLSFLYLLNPDHIASGSSLMQGYIDDYDDIIKHKIKLAFGDGVYSYVKLYYDCVIKELKAEPLDGVGAGEITFSLPVKGLHGLSNIPIIYDAVTGSDIANQISAFDTARGY